MQHRAAQRPHPTRQWGQASGAVATPILDHRVDNPPLQGGMLGRLRWFVLPKSSRSRIDAPLPVRFAYVRKRSLSMREGAHCVF